MNRLCGKCGKTAVHEIGTSSYCAVHLDAILAGIRARVIEREAHDGVGRQSGELLPEWGEGWAILKCDMCHASWGGIDGDRCSWCLDRAATVLTEQAAKVLRRPAVDPADKRYDAVMHSWAARLGRAVGAGIITEAQGRAALARIAS